MDIDLSNTYMQNLKDYIFDENKIVTYKWLSNNLSIHINAAKELLERFVKEECSKNSDLHLVKTYYVSGMLKEDKGVTSTIVQEEKLTSFKESLQSVFSEHIYSIHKGTSATDSNALFLAGEHKDLCIGTITNNSIIKRTFEELSALRLGAYPKSFLSTKLKEVPNVNKNSTIKKEPVSAKPFFNVPVTKKEVESKSETNEKPNEKSTVVASSNKPKQKAGIAGFFAKQINNPKPVVKKEPPVTPKTETEVPDVVINKKETKISPTTSVKVTNDVLKKSNSANKSTEKEPKVNGSHKNSKKSSNSKVASKKRKRIQTIDSDSEEENNVEDIFEAYSPERAPSPLLSDDEDIIPPTPDVIKPNVKAPLNSRKRKKTVDTTFMDENGFLITKKEELLETCSEDEGDDVKSEEKSSKVTPPSNNQKIDKSPKKQISPEGKKSRGKKKTSPPEKVKQQSLMNFFKKAPK